VPFASTQKFVFASQTHVSAAESVMNLSVLYQLLSLSSVVTGGVESTVISNDRPLVKSE